jgi:hypothetical protein
MMGRRLRRENDMIIVKGYRAGKKRAKVTEPVKNALLSLNNFSSYSLDPSL